MIKIIIISIMIFCYITLVKPIFLGFPALYLLAPFGVFLFLNDVIKKGFNIDADFFKFFLLLLIVIFSFLMTMIINQNGDVFYIKEILQFNVICFFSAYFIVKFYIKNFNDDIHKFVLIFSNAVFLQLFISFIALINPDFFGFIFSIIDSTILFEGALNSFSDFRMVAIGTPFFGSAIVNCFTLFLISSYYPESRYKKYLLFLWISISILGMISARTTIIGIVISLIIYIVHFYKLKSNILIYLFIFTFFIFLILPYIKLNEQFSNIQNFAFEFLLDFKNSKASDSTEDLLQMYQVVPNNLKTWLIGDGFFKNEEGFYYKEIDIGYLRVVFASGLFGLLIYLIINIYVIMKSKMPYSILLFAMLLILNFKGFTNMTYLFILFFIFITLNKKAMYNIKYIVGSK